MSGNRLFSNIITGTAILASLTTGGMAGLKVFANKDKAVTVPELPISMTSASPSPSPTVISGEAQNQKLDDDLNSDELILPSSTPMISEFPIDSMKPGNSFDDEDEGEELRHKANSEEREHEEREDDDHDD